MTERFRVVPAAYVFLFRDGEVLLQRRQNTGYRDGFWAAAAAGHVEQHESVLDAAAREAAEELGITMSLSDLVPLCCMHRTGDNGLAVDERVDFFFSCSRWSGAPRVMEQGKNAGIEWFPLMALPEPVVPHELVVLERLLAGDLPAVVTFGF